MCSVRHWRGLRSKSVVAAILLLLDGGCSGSGPHPSVAVVPAAGVLTYQGRPVANAQLTFHAATAAESGFAQTDAKGKFRCMTNDSGDGIPPGDYVVSVSRVKMTIPKQYTDPETSPLSVTVEDGEDNQFQLELTD